MDGILDSVLKRLASFGCTAPDEWAVQFCIGKAENHIRNQINRADIPAELAEVLTDRACGEYLQSAYAAGKLELESLDLTNAVQSVSEGDTSVTFAANASDSARLSVLISSLLTAGEEDLLCFRKLRW